MCSAIATQASLALAIAMHLIMVSTVCVSPGSRNTWLPPIEAACSETVTVSSGEIEPSSTASKIIKSVIILVMLAGCRLSSAFFSYITRPVEASVRMAHGASISGPSAFTGTITDITVINTVSQTTIFFINQILK